MLNSLMVYFSISFAQLSLGDYRLVYRYQEIIERHLDQCNRANVQLNYPASVIGFDR